jgi:pyruvate,water dikinase
MSELVVQLASAAATDAERFGPKAANQALLGRAGLPIPEGFCVDAEAYRLQLASLASSAEVAEALGSDDAQARRQLARLRIGLYEQPIVPDVLEPLLEAWCTLTGMAGPVTAVRSSALGEDRAGSTFAGQFESFIGLESEAEFLTAVRACWAALWSSRALRYMAGHGLDPTATAMAVLVQPMVAARASGGGLSQTADGGRVLSATWGLGEAIAQGEVVPDRYVLSRAGELRDYQIGRKSHTVGCARHQAPVTRSVPEEVATQVCLDNAQVEELGGLLARAEALMDMPVEIEWAMDDAGFKLLQARPLQVNNNDVPDEIWQRHPRLNGHPGGVGWGTGRARVINCECELSRVAPGDVLVTSAAGPALSAILPRVAGVVAELGGSTSHLASLARERGTPMVLGVLDATRHIPDGAQVAVDGVAGVVRWSA